MLMPFAESKNLMSLGPLHRIKFSFTLLDKECTFQAHLAFPSSSVKSTGPVCHSVFFGHLGRIKLKKQVFSKQIGRLAPIAHRRYFSIKANPLSRAPAHPKTPGPCIFGMKAWSSITKVAVHCPSTLHNLHICSLKHSHVCFIISKSASHVF